MAKMGGVNYVFNSAKSAQGANRVRPADWAMNRLSKGGVNKDLGGGATSGAAQGVPAGKANDGNPGRQSSSGSSKGPVQRG